MFTITREQYQRYTQWQRELNERIAKQQLSSKKFFDGTQLSENILDMIRKSVERGEPQPYYGAIGGAYTFSFTATSMGEIVKVENGVTGDSINLTNYEDW